MSLVASKIDYCYSILHNLLGKIFIQITCIANNQHYVVIILPKPRKVHNNTNKWYTVLSFIHLWTVETSTIPRPIALGGQ